MFVVPVSYTHLGADAQAATAIPNTIDTKKTLVLIISIISSILLIPETPHYPADLNGTPHNIRNTERIIPDQTIRCLLYTSIPKRFRARDRIVR